MKMTGNGKKLRVYVDTSVIGGCFDDEFEAPSINLFKRAKAGGAIIVVSDTTFAELESAPKKVRDVIASLPEASLEFVHQNKESETLAAKYIQQGVVSQKMLADAMHIALATVIKADVLVSWNFRHIVNLDRIHGYNSVNLRAGYPMLEIRTPLEIWKDEDEIL